MSAYYNENDEFAADWLRNVIKARLIADGEVDTRSIVDVRADDLRGFTQCHFFAGIGGWSYALRAAGWDDHRPAWTGSCPCQPFSLAGAQRGFADERHLWPVWRDLVEVLRPSVVFGEQVASATEWLGLVRSDLEKMGYAVGALPIQAASAGADHLRDRYWFVADGQSERGWSGLCEGRPIENRDGLAGGSSADQLANADDAGPQGRQLLPERSGERAAGQDGLDAGLIRVVGADGKARRVKSGIRLLAHGIPNRVGLLRGFGNAIDPRPAAAFIGAFMTVSDTSQLRQPKGG
jgi:DNA (cytosine-5)-methyltransferase 1